MKRKMHLTRMLLVIVTLLSMSSCVRDDLAAESQSQKNSKNMSAKFASRSFWKEDNIYINKVQQVFLKVANLEHVRARYGELNWDYAMTFGNFNETYALVPIIKDNKVVLLMEAVRTGNKVFFYEKDNKDLVEFFNLAMYSNVTKYDEVIEAKAGVLSKTPAFVCTTRWLTIGCFDNETDCVPYTTSVTNCEYQGGSGIPPKTFDPIGMDGGGDGNNGYEYPEIPEEIDPCSKLKLQTNNSTFKSNILALEGKTGESSERGYRMDYKNQTPTNPSGTGTNNQFLQNAPGSTVIDYKYFLPSTYAILHTHYNSLYDPIFSPGDIIQFNDWVVKAKAWNDNPANTIKIDLTKLSYTLVTSWGNYTITFDGTNVVPFNNYDIKTLNDDYIEKVITPAMTVANVSGDVSFNIEDLEEGFLKFAKKSLSMPGMKLFKVESSGNTEIFLKPNNTRDTKPCY
ncbi:hypothetical protein N6B72_05195 [Chryseobacterium soli]|uniref:hypothetical protein n=1 Tax=Chryseobacterium soli TaxID=445961 RepID=UPI0029549FAB|nr:hypothetical protein [Chryseobacterium soli]MDV7696311.1 hypothetical protein [Chryseobacterium soli]